MSQPATPTPAPLRFNLMVPGAKLSFGPLTIDPLAAAIGRPLEDVLRPLLAGAAFERPGQGGQLFRAYPLILAPGVGASIPLAILGEVGVANDGGTLKLTGPAPLSGWLSNLPYRLHGPVPEAGVNGVLVAAVWLRVPTGQSVSVPIGMLGSIVLEAA
jgi:hypothetical protein